MTIIPAPARILLVALDNLGDLVFASALTPPLHAAFPSATIDVWCKAYTSPIARLIPFVREVVAADPVWAVPAHLERPRLAPFLRSIGIVRRERYDVAVVTGGPWRTAAAVAAARIPVRIGLARRHNAHFLTHPLAAEDKHKPVVRELARLLAPLQIAAGYPHYELSRNALRADVARMEERLPPRFAALHAFAGARDRCVPLDEWLRLAEMIESRGVPVLWIGMPAELAELRSITRRPPGLFIDDIGDGSLEITAAALSRAALFVGHDSGPLHVAAALGVLVVAVFAPGEPDRTFPQGPGAWRMISRASPARITAETMLREIESLGLFSTT